MNIPKAIEILSRTVAHSRADNTPHVRDAIKLGIEALQRVREERTGYESYAPDLLLGETLEEER